jgi:hypothetical protein
MMTSAKVTLPVAAVLSALLIANGLFMVINPESWYYAVPGVVERGPFNQHFIRDIGFLYTIMGACFIVGTRMETARLPLWLLPSLWLTSHALFHVWEVIVGICGPASLLEDFAGVTLPAIIGLALSWSAKP